MLFQRNSFMTAMLRGRLLSGLIRLSSSCVVPSPAPSSSVNSPDVDSDGTSDANKDLAVDETWIPSNNKHYVKKKKITRPRFAMLLSFHGSNYYGMQFNSHGPAIENILFDAFIKIGLLPEEKIRAARYYLDYQRASRTDRGVSALRQVVSLRITKGFNIDGINEFLPDDIRVLGIKPVDMIFDAQTWCTARTYSYIMPTYALRYFDKSWNDCHKYRIDSLSVLKASQIFEMFRGTHHFHNYTEKIDIWDQRSQRKINDTEVSNPFLMGEVEMIEFKLTGQSFMLHQIRRMIGMVIAIMRGKATFSMLQETLEHPMMPAPTAPALGLLLEKGLLIAITSLTFSSMETYLDRKMRRHSFKGNDLSSKMRQVGKWDNTEDLEKLLKGDEDDSSKEK
ncbi:tRNA pseudouridine synthase 1-like isoform X2 [Thrips palmi]|uniref:Pseudouridylate synthase 1 homolog n=1 Tax=Thrips palmi TaxID=161013 RepID=A0A6P8YEV3_THRPL|nr:tRNA pseudouridine synthase 1-like isoform X2 [Thrips palmi]